MENTDNCKVCGAKIEIRHVHSSMFGRVDTCSGPKCAEAVYAELDKLTASLAERRAKEHAAAVEARKEEARAARKKPIAKAKG